MFTNNNSFETINSIETAELISKNEILVKFSKTITDISEINFNISNSIEIKKIEISSIKKSLSEIQKMGFMLEKENITFLFDEKIYNLTLTAKDKVYVATSLNGWKLDWELFRDKDNIFKLRKSIYLSDNEIHMFKFVINASQWLSPPANVKNIADDGFGGTNLILSKQIMFPSEIKIMTTDMDIKNNYLLTCTVDNYPPQKKEIQVIEYLKKFYSGKKLGTFYESSTNKTYFRVFSPRAKSVKLFIYQNPDDISGYLEENLSMDNNGIWETSVEGNLDGKYYNYSIDGPGGTGEYFNKNVLVSDLYAFANVHNDGKSIIYDMNKKNDIFNNWEDADYHLPDFSDLIISEIHIRDFTADESSKVEKDLRGKYLGIIDTLGKGTGIDHLINTGINAIEFLPTMEFDDFPYGTYHWGYMSSLFFSPESSYAMHPETGSQVQELKKVINELHKNKIAVLMDVVYNHVGAPNHFSYYDNKYYFRLKPDMSYSNFSGCGNDFKSENPMARKMILESIIHFVKYYHVDGFRFDLAELIDMETLILVRNEALKINPNLIFIAEPWSYHGNIKNALKGTGWASWNDDFRNNVKDFAVGKGNINMLKKVIAGSIDLWAETPLQSINYVESHDDYTLTDDLSLRPDRNGRIVSDIEKSRNKICAILLFTSLGIPMIAGGQEFLRSKKGVHNSYNKGDEINSIKWDYAIKNKNILDYYKGLISMRQSNTGKIFRFAKKPRKDYIKWFQNNNPNSIGYLMNANEEAGKEKALILINASHTENAEFKIEIPEGNWIEITDSDKANPDGTGKNIKVGNVIDIELPKISAKIFILQ